MPHERKVFLLTFVQLAADCEPSKIALKIRGASPLAVYTDKLSGKSYTGQELNEGITVETTASEERFCRMWELVKNE